MAEVSSQLVKQYLRDYPEVQGSRTLARMLRADHPEVFSSIDHARSCIRYQRGNIGKKNRRHQVDKTHFRKNAKPGAFQLPKGQRRGKKPFILPKPSKVLLLNDMHVPYHDESAIEAALRHGHDSKCDTLYLNGDSIDFYKLSRFVKDPRKRSPKKECDMLHSLLKEIGKPFEKKYFKKGNHEDRWDLYLFTRAEDLVDFEEFELKNVLRLDELGYGFVESRQLAKMGGLHVLHGHEMPRGISNPVNPARGLWLRIKSTGLVGHYHRSSQHSESHPVKKQYSSTWSVGCLCDLSPEYASLNEWNLGFAEIDVSSNGKFNVENYMVVDGEVYSA